MTVEQERMKAFLEADFVPAHNRTAMAPAEERAAAALEFIAYRIGKIEKTLAKISEEMHVIAGR